MRGLLRRISPFTLTVMSQPEKKNDKKQKKNALYAVSEYLYSVLGAALAVFTAAALVFVFFLRPVSVSGDSMNPTLANGSKILVSQFLYKPAYGDIIAFGKVNSEDSSVIKRVIGLPGDTVDINFDTHIITVNGDVITDKFKVTGPISEKGDVEFPVTVPEGCVFVLGDNRNNSKDSRFSEIGFVLDGEILGKALVGIYPPGPIR